MTPELEQWIQAHYERLYEYAKYRCHGVEVDAQDLLQEVLTHVCEGRLQVDLSRSPLTFLQRVLQSRKRLLYVPVMAMALPEEAQSVWEQQEPSQRMEWMVQWIAQLKPDQQQAVQYYCDHGMHPPNTHRLHYHWEQARRILAQKAQALVVDEASGDRERGGGSRSPHA